MIDYKKRSEHLMATLDIWIAQRRWEAKHGIKVVKWEAAFKKLHAVPEGGAEESRNALLHEAMFMLEIAQQALGNHPTSKQISKFCESVARFKQEEHEKDIVTYADYKVGDQVRIVGRPDSPRLKKLAMWGVLDKIGTVVELPGVQRDDYYVIEMSGRRGLVHPAELEHA